ncbi:hypothetical protein, partial [Enterococcus faecium]
GQLLQPSDVNNSSTATDVLVKPGDTPFSLVRVLLCEFAVQADNKHIPIIILSMESLFYLLRS